MSSEKFNITEKYYSKDKVNQIGKKILKNRCKYSEFKTEFSIIFLSDTHTDKSSLKSYASLLREMVHHQDILCIIHGGDAIRGVNNDANKSVRRLKQFIDITKLELYEGNESNKRIPFFMNTGNHDYCHEKKELSKVRHFEDLVGNTTDIIKIYNQPIDIILLDTGYTHTGFPKASTFINQLHIIDKKIRKSHKNIKYILDMHIPPQLGYFKNYSNHTLNHEQTNEFSNFLDKHQNRISAVITHHIHHSDQTDISIPVYRHPRGDIPIYLTANCNNHISEKNYHALNKYLKMNLERQGHNIKIISIEEITL